MSDWEEFQDVNRDQIFLHYYIYRLETKYVDHPSDRHTYQTLRIVEGENVLWRIGDGYQKERSITKQAQIEQGERKAVITRYYRKKLKIKCPHTNKWSDVDPALLIP